MEAMETAMELLRAEAVQLREEALKVEPLEKRVNELENLVAANNFERDQQQPDLASWATVVKGGSTAEKAAVKATIRALQRETKQEEDRASNICVSNLPSEDTETAESLATNVEKLLAEKLGLSSPKELVSSIKRVHPARGARSATPAAHDKPAKVIIRCRSIAAKIQVMRAKSGLRGTTISMDHDYTWEQQSSIRERLAEMKAARAEGKSAFFNAQAELIIRDRNTGERQGDWDGNGRPQRSQTTSHSARAR
ncbi:hypothetical protein WJX72_011594 [[Myrmecia] bisecta]|uniref:Uncharacterized protein n=1 Tax=[Myrmecia] bisecta TaxID=41462 RepID=A0AAW1P8S5_9CHLO